jgi:hypothetical protein
MYATRAYSVIKSKSFKGGTFMRLKKHNNSFQRTAISVMSFAKRKSRKSHAPYGSR